MVLEAQVDFIAVVEHRLIQARVRSEWARLRAKGLASVWAPGLSGQADVGVITLRGAPVCLPTIASAHFKRFFDCAPGRFMHLVVLDGYQGADSDAEQLALTEQFVDAAMSELGVVAQDKPCVIVGDFNVEPTKIPCLPKGISAGLQVNLESAWAYACGRQPSVICKRTWGSADGQRRGFIVG